MSINWSRRQTTRATKGEPVIRLHKSDLTHNRYPGKLIRRLRINLVFLHSKPGDLYKLEDTIWRLLEVTHNYPGESTGLIQRVRDDSNQPCVECGYTEYDHDIDITMHTCSSYRPWVEARL